VKGRKDEWMNEWKDGWKEGRMNEWMNEWKTSKSRKTTISSTLAIQWFQGLPFLQWVLLEITLRGHLKNSVDQDNLASCKTDKLWGKIKSMYHLI